MSRRASRREERTARRAERKASKARAKLEKLQRRRDLAKAKGKLAKADKIDRKMGRVAAKGGVSKTGRVPGAPGVGVRRRAPRHKFRIRKGRREMWSSKYRGWVAVKGRRKPAVAVKEEIKDIREAVDELKTLIAVIR